MYLALTGLFRATWSAGVHEEWMSALLRNRPDLSREKLERTRMPMDRHAEDALVTGYEDLIPGLHLPDPDDRHVLAAAIRGRADVTSDGELTRRSRGHSRGVRDRGATPGRIRVALLDLAPGIVADAARTHRESLKNPPKTIDEFLSALEALGLAQTVSVLREYMS